MLKALLSIVLVAGVSFSAFAANSTTEAPKKEAAKEEVIAVTCDETAKVDGKCPEKMEEATLKDQTTAE